MQRNLLIGSMALIGALSTCPAAAAIVEMAPVQDSTLYEDAEGDVGNGSGQGLFIGRAGSDGEESLRRALVKFDLSGIPGNAVVTGVEVQFTLNKVPQAGGEADTATLHRLTRAWGEGGSNPSGAEGQGAAAQSGDATWLHTFFNGAFWTTPGGDFEPVASSSVAFGTATPELLAFPGTPQLVEDVQGWVANPAGNHGWLLRGDEIRAMNARRIASRECPSDPTCFDDPPKLIVDYSVPAVTDHLTLTELTSALTNPVSIAHAGDGSGRLFIVEQEGIIRIYNTASGSLLGTPFLDIQDEVHSLVDPNGFNEQGLLGLAFHPDYANNGRFFVNYTSSPSSGTWHTVVAEFAVSGNPDVAMNIGTTILEYEQDYINHNGGDLHFGADGFLYIASGDGGGIGDPYGNAQNLDTLRGALLRIDVDSTALPGAELCGIVSDYGIPPGNPFQGNNDGCDEILHYGLRNPWRFSFDAASGDLWIADVGQNAWEEVNKVPGDAAGLNFGWPCREGMHAYPTAETCAPPLTEPILEYAHAEGNCSITGGYVYRGDRLPLAGRYLHGDWCTERIWLATEQGGAWSSEEWPGVAATLSSLSSFGQDENCELYLVDRQAGALHRIDDTERLFGAGFESRTCR